MRIGLLSDTHIPEACRLNSQFASDLLWPALVETFRGVDLIFHAGDIIELSVLDWLENIAPVLSARGNHDTHLPEDPRLKETHVLNFHGFRVGLIHRFDPDDEFLERHINYYFNQSLDIVVFGDTHLDMVARRDGVLLVNPGSPTYPRNMSTRLGTVGILEITESNSQAHILQLKPASAPSPLNPGPSN